MCRRTLTESDSESTFRATWTTTRGSGHSGLEHPKPAHSGRPERTDRGNGAGNGSGERTGGIARGNGPHEACANGPHEACARAARANRPTHWYGPDKNLALSSSTQL